MENVIYSEKNESPIIEEVKNKLVEILKIHPDEWPDDKQIEIQINYVTVPDSVNIKICKK